MAKYLARWKICGRKCLSSFPDVGFVGPIELHLLHRIEEPAGRTLRTCVAMSLSRRISEVVPNDGDTFRGFRGHSFKSLEDLEY